MLEAEVDDPTGDEGVGELFGEAVEVLAVRLRLADDDGVGEAPGGGEAAVVGVLVGRGGEDALLDAAGARGAVTEGEAVGEEARLARGRGT